MKFESLKNYVNQVVEFVYKPSVDEGGGPIGWEKRGWALVTETRLYFLTGPEKTMDIDPNWKGGLNCDYLIWELGDLGKMDSLKQDIGFAFLKDLVKKGKIKMLERLPGQDW